MGDEVTIQPNNEPLNKILVAQFCLAEDAVGNDKVCVTDFLWGHWYHNNKDFNSEKPKNVA